MDLERPLSSLQALVVIPTSPRLVAPYESTRYVVLADSFFLVGATLGRPLYKR